jgi:hypothetical protein
MDEMTDGNAAEHHAPHPEADPLDLEAAQPEAERGDRAKQKDAESDVTHADTELWFGSNPCGDSQKTPRCRWRQPP